MRGVRCWGGRGCLPLARQSANLEPMSLQQVLDKSSLLGRATQREPEAVSEKQASQARVDIIAGRLD